MTGGGVGDFFLHVNFAVPGRGGGELCSEQT